MLIPPNSRVTLASWLPYKWRHCVFQGFHLVRSKHLVRILQELESDHKTVTSTETKLLDYLAMLSETSFVWVLCSTISMWPRPRSRIELMWKKCRMIVKSLCCQCHLVCDDADIMLKPFPLQVVLYILHNGWDIFSNNGAMTAAAPQAIGIHYS